MFMSKKFSVPLTNESIKSGQAGGVFRQLFLQCSVPKMPLFHSGMDCAANPIPLLISQSIPTHFQASENQGNSPPTSFAAAGAIGAYSALAVAPMHVAEFINPVREFKPALSGVTVGLKVGMTHTPL